MSRKPSKYPNDVRIGGKIMISEPGVYKSPRSSTNMVEGTVVFIDTKGRYATVEYFAQNQRVALRTSVQVRPVMRTNRRGEVYKSHEIVNKERSSKIGGPLNSSVPTPFGQDMVNAAARR